MCNECDLCRIDANLCNAARRELKALAWPPLGDHGGLLDRMRQRAKERGKSLIISSSYVGGNLPEQEHQQHCHWCDEITHFDYLNLHGNNLWQWKDGASMPRPAGRTRTRRLRRCAPPSVP